MLYYVLRISLWFLTFCFLNPEPIPIATHVKVLSWSLRWTTFGQWSQFQSRAYGLGLFVHLIISWGFYEKSTKCFYWSNMQAICCLTICSLAYTWVCEAFKHSQFWVKNREYALWDWVGLVRNMLSFIV